MKFGPRGKHIERRIPCKGEDQDWVDAPTSQKEPKIASNLPEARRESHGTVSLSQPSEGTDSGDTLILDF